MLAEVIDKEIPLKINNQLKYETYNLLSPTHAPLLILFDED